LHHIADCIRPDLLLNVYANAMLDVVSTCLTMHWRINQVWNIDLVLRSHTRT